MKERTINKIIEFAKSIFLAVFAVTVGVIIKIVKGKFSNKA